MSRNYDKAFKLNAINVYKKSGRTAQTIAEELGIPKSTFEAWIRCFKEKGEESFPGKGQLNPEAAELRALRRELHHVTQERDILKKALAIFSSPSGKGTSS